MREIKFRGKNIITNKWVYGHYMEQPNDFEEEGGYFKPTGIGSFISDFNLLGRDLFAVDSETIGQYTGIHDDSEEETEIYEGDKIEFVYEGYSIIGIVKFEAGTFIIASEELGDSYITFLSIIQSDRDYWWINGIVVGNIYEN